MILDSHDSHWLTCHFNSKIWDTHTGEPLATLQHNHIVRAVAYPPDNSDLVATGGFEKKLRIFDITEMKPQATDAEPKSDANPNANEFTIPASAAFEIGVGVHTASIKFIVWTKDPNILITASDNTLRWFDLPSKSVIKQEVLDGEIGSCEFSSLAPEYTSESDVGDGLPVLAVAAGKTVYFWGGLRAMDELKSVKMEYKVASVALDPRGRKFVVGEDIPATWARVYRWDDDSETGMSTERNCLSISAQFYA